MSQEEEKYINELVEKFKYMPYQEQQEELKRLYTTSEIVFVEVSDKYRDAVIILRAIQKHFTGIEYK